MSSDVVRTPESLSGFPSPPRVRRLLPPLLAVLVVLFGVEILNPGQFPLAALVALLLVYAATCFHRLETAMVLVLALTPFSVEMSLDAGALQIPTEPLLFVALTAWGCRWLARGPTTTRGPALALALLAALATCLLSIVDSAHRFAALKAVISASWYALFGIFVLNNFDRTNRIKSLCAALLVPGTLITLWSLVQVGLGRYDRSAGLWAAWPFFTEHGSFAAYLSFGFALFVGLALESRGPAQFLLWSGAGLTGLQIVLSMTRGAWLGLAGFGLFVLSLYWRRLLRPAPVVFLLLGLGGLTSGLIATGVWRQLEMYTQVTSRGNYTSNLERVNRWYAGLRMFQSDPLTGVGYGTYPDLYHHYRRFSVGTSQSNMRMGIHNEYLKVIAETGVIGALSAMVVAGLILALAIRVLRRTPPGLPRGVAIGFCGGLLTYAIHATVNNFLVYDKVAMPLWTAVGGLAALDLMNPPPPTRSPGDP